MRKTLLVPIMALMALALMTPLAQATVYSKSATSFPTMYPPCHIYLVVDTGTHTIQVKWDGAGFIALPLPSGFCFLVWQVWDDKGWGKSGFGGRYGTQTFNYYNTYTWVHAACTWGYIGAFWALNTMARVDVYVSV